MTDPRPLTRADLAKFLPDQRAIRAFEKLFDIIPSDIERLYAQIEEASLDANSANSKAVSALAVLTLLKTQLELQDQVAPPEHVRSVALDYVDLRKFAPHAHKVGRIAWNEQEDTINIHHEGGVVQQVGEELYERMATNNLGVQINNGECIGLAGSGTDIAKFIADGTYPSLYIIGIATQNIPSGEAGRITVWGRVRDIDTSGWAVGDVLYVSTTTAGGLTNVKPTAPNLSIPIAVVLVSHATSGVIFVRPTIEQQLYYGAFTKTVDASPAAINTAYAITFDTTEASNGISIGTPTSRIVADNSGLYSFSVSFQLVSGSASVKNVWLWFRKNGVDIANSAMKVSLDSGTAVKAPSRSLFFSLAAGDYMELMWAADDTNVTLDALASTAFAPAAPACVLTVEQIQQ